MKIFLMHDEHVYPGMYPAITLKRTSWDDFGFRTEFSVYLWTDRKTSHDLKAVKIMQLGMRSGKTPLLDEYDEGLPEDYASLGADYDYYQNLSRISGFGVEVLDALNDLAVDPVRLQRFSQAHAFNASLARLAPAKDALRRIQGLREEKTVELPHDEEAHESVPYNSRDPWPGTILAKVDLVGLRPQASGETASVGHAPLHFGFTPKQSGKRALAPSTVQFNFNGPEQLPGNLIAMIGPNGTGKTTLLAGLALTLFFGSGSQGAHGNVELISGSVRDVIFFSYSAYDSFEIPRDQTYETTPENELQRQGYVYIGLRKLNTRSSGSADKDEPHTLKSIKEIDNEFATVLQSLESQSGRPVSRDGSSRLELFVKSIKTLLKDPSFSRILDVGANPTAAKLIKTIKQNFPGLSTGHKAVVNVVASLCLHLNTNSLVLLDEPEAHLHPPLIASLLRVTRTLLSEFHAHAIAATHSPVVIQETLGRHVLVLNRVGNRTNWSVSPRETFGENLSSLTRDSLGLPADKSDYIGQLEALIGESTQLQEVEELFGNQMSSPARAQALRIINARQASRKP